MKIVVIGARGQLGQDLMRELRGELIGLDHQDFDVTDGVTVSQTLETLRPDWVVNTAGFHRVDECEINPRLSFGVNALGAGDVARVCARIGSRLLFCSTDYVFGGASRGPGRPYTETDAPDPVNVYGISKAAGERLVLHAHPGALIVRASGLYGMSTSKKGWTFPELMLQLAATCPLVRVVDDQVLSPTNTLDLARTMRTLIDEGHSGIYHVVNDGECSWYEFARATFELTRTAANLEPQTTEEAGRRARRPAYSAMASHALPAPLRHWREALADYLRQKGRLAPA